METLKKEDRKIVRKILGPRGSEIGNRLKKYNSRRTF